jgi:xylulokinase
LGGRTWDSPTGYDSWLDTRCGPYIPRLKEHEQQIIALTGGPPTISHGAKILWWKHEQPDVYQRIARFVQPGGYVAGRLAGLKGDQAFVDRTYIHFSCFSDTQAGTWSDGLLTAFDVEKDKLPHIVNSSDIIGYVTGEAAAASGLKAGTPIAAGCGDQVPDARRRWAVRAWFLMWRASVRSRWSLTVHRSDLSHAFTAHRRAGAVLYARLYQRRRSQPPLVP